MTVTREARFAHFVETHRERAVGLAWRLLGGDRAVAEDVVQQAFLAAWRALPRFRDEAALSTWFHRIVVRQARSHQRWSNVRRRLGWKAADPVTVAPAPTGDIGLQRRISQALMSLSAGQREAFVLVHLEGMTITEAAEATGRAPGTLKSHLHRALKSLRAQLGDLREEGS